MSPSWKFIIECTLGRLEQKNDTAKIELTNGNVELQLRPAVN